MPATAHNVQLVVSSARRRVIKACMRRTCKRYKSSHGISNTQSHSHRPTDRQQRPTLQTQKTEDKDPSEDTDPLPETHNAQTSDPLFFTQRKCESFIQDPRCRKFMSSMSSMLRNRSIQSCAVDWCSTWPENQRLRNISARPRPSRPRLSRPSKPLQTADPFGNAGLYARNARSRNAQLRSTNETLKITWQTVAKNVSIRRVMSAARGTKATSRSRRT